MHATDGNEGPGRGTILLLATGAGLSVASIYYNQPMLALMAGDLRATPTQAGLVPTLTQLGYALGILFLTLLGDWTDRRRVILAKGAVLSIVLAATALSGSPCALLASSLVLGLSATLAQDIVPTAAALSGPARRGKTVGSVMTGLLLGILLSRVASGFAARFVGWRPVYLAASASIALFLIVAARFLPSLPPRERVTYPRLLSSLLELWSRHPRVRRAALSQGLVSIGFSAYWSTLAPMLSRSFHLGSDVAGLFGLAGAAGALGAPWAGRLADRRGPVRAVRLGGLAVAAAFAFMGSTSSLPSTWRLWALAAGTVGFDLGYQFCLVPHQSLVYGLDPAARSRLNALLFVGMFLGMSVGSALGSALDSRFGFTAVALLGSVSGLGAAAVHAWRAPSAA